MELDMTKGKVHFVILKFTFPLILGNIFQQLYNMVDTIIVGRYLGANAIAALGATGTIMFLILGFAQGITSGFSVLTAQKYGQKDYQGIRRSVANGIILSLIISFVLTIFSVLIMRDLLKIMNTPLEVFEDAYLYIIIISLGLVSSVFYNLFSSYLRAVGNSKIPLLFLIFSSILNIFLDLIFIVNFKLGVGGAALATVLAQGFSALICLIYIFLKVDILKPKKSEWFLACYESKHQLSIGIPMALQFSITALGTMIMQATINMFGALAVAAYTAAGKLQNLLMQGMIALGQSMASYTAQNYGKGDFERIKKGVKTAFIFSVSYSLFASVLGYILLKPALLIFFKERDNFSYIFHYGSVYLYMCIIFYIPLSLIFIFRNIMQACAYGFLPMLGGVIELLARIIGSYIAARVFSYPLACFADPLAWISAGLFVTLACRNVIKKVEKNLSLKV